MKCIDLFASFFILFSTFTLFGRSAPAETRSSVRVAYITQSDSEYFQNVVKPLFQSKIGSCKCEIINVTPMKEGQFHWGGLGDFLSREINNYEILLFDFNVKLTQENQHLLEKLNKWVEKGNMVVASAGEALKEEPTSPLNKTLFGKVEKALIIGDLQRAERLPPKGFYGPEILTALSSPQDLEGKKVSSILFVSRLAANWSSKNSSRWYEDLNHTKSKTKRLWPLLEDLFRKRDLASKSDLRD